MGVLSVLVSEEVVLWVKMMKLVKIGASGRGGSPLEKKWAYMGNTAKNKGIDEKD